MAKEFPQIGFPQIDVQKALDAVRKYVQPRTGGTIPMEFRPATPSGRLYEVVGQGNNRKIIFAWALMVRDLPKQLVELTLVEAILMYYYPEKNADWVHSIVDDYITSDSSRLSATLEAIEQAREKGISPEETWVERLKTHMKGRQ